MAGVWGHSTEQRQLLEQGEMKEGLNAASAVGDDRLQRMSTGHVNPETFTHGSSADRTRRFERGFDGGGLDRCNNFQYEHDDPHPSPATPIPAAGVPLQGHAFPRRINSLR